MPVPTQVVHACEGVDNVLEVADAAYSQTAAHRYRLLSRKLPTLHVLKVDIGPIPIRSLNAPLLTH